MPDTPEISGPAPAPVHTPEQECTALREQVTELERLCRTTLEASSDLVLHVWLEEGELRLESTSEQLIPSPAWEASSRREVLDALRGHERLTAKMALALLHHTRFVEDYALTIPGRISLWVRVSFVPRDADRALVAVSNLTKTKRMERELISWQERYHRLTGELADYIFSVEVRDGVPVSTTHTPACLAITGYAPDELADDPYLWINMVLEEDRGAIIKQATDILQGRKVAPVEHRIRRKDGVVRWVRNTSIPHFDDQQRLIGYDGLVQDITERHQAQQALRENEELFRTLAEFSSDMVFWHDPNENLRYVSPACSMITGYSAEEIRQRPDLFHTLIHSPNCHVFLAALGEGGNCTLPHMSEFSFKTKEGETRWMSHICRPVLDSEGRYLGLRGSNRDITEQKEAEAQLHAYMDEIKTANLKLELQKEQLEKHQEELLRANGEMQALTRQLTQSNTELSLLARTDPLTRLLNRRAWEETLRHEHTRALRHQSPYSILMIDVDHFKNYNDSKGHQAGDTCLRQVAECLASSCRGQDFVGRYGGEEFVVLATVTAADDALHLAERIRQSVGDLKLDHATSPVSKFVTVSVGIATHDPEEPWERTIGRADEALYVAKSQGRNRVAGSSIPYPQSPPLPEAAENADGR